MRNDLEYDLCLGCGEISPEGQGIIPLILHSCPLNTVKYRGGGRFTFRKFAYLMGEDPMKSFKDLLVFPHFKAMEITPGTTWYDVNAYSHARDLEIKWMKRLRAYIELEEDFDAKY